MSHLENGKKIQDSVFDVNYQKCLIDEVRNCYFVQYSWLVYEPLK
jgi:hypothetical protein